jgi:hypothetical protein
MEVTLGTVQHALGCVESCQHDRYSVIATPCYIFAFSHNASTLKKSYHFSYRSRLMESIIASYSYRSGLIGNVIPFYTFVSDNITKAITCYAVTI